MTVTPYLGQSTDLVLGQEFLTWLWYKSATGTIFSDSTARPFTVSMEQRIVVQGGEGETMETASVSGMASQLHEARIGLTTGKKVTRALIRLERDTEAWQLTLKAADFSLNSLKTPKVEVPDRHNKDDSEGVFLEKIYLIETCLSLLDIIYRDFLTARLDDKAWTEEVAAIRLWMQSA